MNVANVSQAVDIQLLKQAMAAQQAQALAPVTSGIVNQLASIDPSLGQNLDIQV
ncbi:MAG TPA: putative motility protein [Bacilli bacterium]|nr:putative motility protein [Bacilli bacterium]